MPAGGGAGRSRPAAQARRRRARSSPRSATTSSVTAALDELAALGVRVEAVFRDAPQRRAFTHVDANGERTITVMGARLGPHGDDPPPWDELDDVDAVFFCAGDDDAFGHGTPREDCSLRRRGKRSASRASGSLDAVVGSAKDPAETIHLDRPPTRARRRDARRVRRPVRDRRRDARALRARTAARSDVVCAYGAGDSFVAGLTYGLGAGLARDEAFALAADCGAACLTGRGPYEAQLSSG